MPLKQLITSVEVDSNQINSNRPILIVDGANLYIRSWAAYPQMTSNGDQFGGVIGFLKKLQYLTRELQPKAVYVVWESGGSSKRRKLYSEYKKGSRPQQLNRFYEDDIPESNENRVYQMTKLLEYLKYSPVCQLYVKDCEADDVIAWLCKSKFRNESKIIISSDKDMYQLLDEKTSLYSLHKKKIINMQDVYSEYHVMPWNFAIAKAICGDQSDNIKGVKGFGFKTAVKYIPLLATHNDIILQDIFNYCHSNCKETKSLQNIIDQQEAIKLNFKLVYLNNTSLNPSQSKRIAEIIDTFKPKANKIALIKGLIREGINNFDVESFLYSFICLNEFNYHNSSNLIK